MKELPEDFGTWNHEECKHVFIWISEDQTGVGWPLTKCEICKEDFIIYQKDKNTRHCYRLLRGHECEIYDFDTGALIVS